ncbi:MAG: prephenate dehydrogenase [Acidaminobacteraceae bacterium]
MDFTDFNIDGFNIGIVGVGLIGGSICKALTEDGCVNVYGIDIDENILDKAKSDGSIIKGFTDASDIIPKLDIVFMCLYEEGIYKFIEDQSNNFKDGVILTDTFGLKKELTENIKNILPHQAIFIGGHPMAGRESFGYEMSDKAIFDNTNYIITTELEDEDNSLSALISCLNKLGDVNIIKADPLEHDKIVALTSHLPHIIATSLVRISKNFDNAKDFVGGSFKDYSRIANINEVLWSDLLLSNKSEVISQIENLENNLRDIKKAIRSGEEEVIKRILVDGRESLEMLKK